MTAPEKLNEARDHLARAFEILDDVPGLQGAELSAVLSIRADLAHNIRSIGNLAVFVGASTR